MSKRLSSFIAVVIAFVSVGLYPAYAVDQRVIDVVEVTWPGAVAPVGNGAAVAKVIDTDVNADWLKFTAMFGDTKDRGVSFKTGQVLKEPIGLVSKMACIGFASSEFMSSIRPEAYKRLGISDYSKRYLLVIVPKAGCVWSGRANLGGPKSQSGTLILHESASSFVISHELGHTFGLGHSNFLRCDNAAYDGAWGETCKGVEYGGTIDVMGNVDTSSPLNTYHQWRMGLIDDSQIKQVWQSENITLAPSDFANGVKVIFIRDGKSAYWIEYRRKTDGAGFKPGLAIYRLDPPPISAVVSVNPEDAEAAEFGSVLGTDVWMLNLDTYQYKDSKSVGGSMTALTAKTYSGNVSFSAVASETSAVVTITKKADTTPPPTPVLVPVDQWSSPNMVILKEGSDDADTSIVGFEGQVDGVVQQIKVSDIEGWRPTYLSPFMVPKTIYLRDLPEGSYSFSIRSVDMIGNKSEWSKPVKAIIDRGDPSVVNDFAVSAVSANDVSLLWRGATDPGAGICQVNVVDEDGLVIQSSSVKNAPSLRVTFGSSLIGTAQVFDCVGNGMVGSIKLTSTFVSGDKSSKTGKWSSASTYGAGAIRCVGKCSASLSVSGKNDVLVGTGAATVAIGNKTVATIKDSKVAKLRVGAVVDTGSTKKVVRITGSNFVLIGLSSISSELGVLKEFDKPITQADASLTDSKQLVLSKLGFRPEDFSPEWVVLPMGGGTKLDDPSLDLCNGTFLSEKERIERRQVVALKENTNFVFLSTEVVRYSSAAAASAAQKELVKVVSQCQIDKGHKDATGATTPYEFKNLKNLPTGVVTEGNRVFVHTVIDSGVQARTLLGFYQFNGDLLTGLYVINTEGFSDEQIAKWLKVAVTMANRLQSKG
jgi:hypothetical protein